MASHWAKLWVGVLIAGASALGASAQENAAATQAAAAQANAPVAGAPAPDAKHTPPPAKKGKKDAYTGPTEVVVLAPTPMLDEEGKQRLDPDGKPMFNPPVAQQRDKHGHPVFDEHGKPVFQTATDLGYDEKGHKLKVKKEKPPKATPVSISRGTYTVDGVIGKAALNYDIPDLKYIYLYAPGVGIAVVSNAPFPGAKEQPTAFDGMTLTVTVDGHSLQLASEKKLLPGKDKHPQPAYVLVDRDFQMPSRFPVVGYGEIRRPPYAWPGSRLNGKFAGPVAPPPIPKDLRPTLALTPCPSGQMRKPAPAALPGQPIPEQPCIPIASAPAKPVNSAAAPPGPPPAAAKD